MRRHADEGARLGAQFSIPMRGNELSARAALASGIPWFSIPMRGNEWQWDELGREHFLFSIPMRGNEITTHWMPSCTH